MKRREILAYAKEQGYDSIRRRGTWQGYAVYEPIMDRPGCPVIGLPYSILVSEDAIRLTDDDECFEVLDHLSTRAVKQHQTP